MIETPHLNLVPKTPDELRAMIDGMSSEEKVELSPDWLARIQAATEPDPWLHGFTIRLRESDVFVGNCGFMAPPNPEGVVEIAYGIEPEHQGKGYATEVAHRAWLIMPAAMTNFASFARTFCLKKMLPRGFWPSVVFERWGKCWIRRMGWCGVGKPLKIQWPGTHEMNR